MVSALLAAHHVTHESPPPSRIERPTFLLLLALPTRCYQEFISSHMLLDDAFTLDKARLVFSWCRRYQRT